MALWCVLYYGGEGLIDKVWWEISGGNGFDVRRPEGGLAWVVGRGEKAWVDR